MIRLVNRGDDQYQAVVPGTLATTSSDLMGPMPFSGQIRAIFARVGTAGTTGTMTVDLLKNGVTLVSSGTLLSWASGATVPTYNTANLLSNPIAITKGDILKLSVTAVHTTPAVDLAILITLERTRDGAQNAQMETDTASARSDMMN